MRLLRVTGTLILLCAICLAGVSPLPAHAEKPEAGMDHFVDGLEAYESGLYDDALALFDQAIEKNGAKLQFQYYYGLTYAKLRKYEEAKAIFTAILALDPKAFHHVYFDLAGIYIKQGQYPQAMKTLDDAEWASPQNPQVYMEKGHLFRMMKNDSKAEDNYKRAMELDPKLTQVACYHMGMARIEAGRYAAANEMFRKASQGPDPDIAAKAKGNLEQSGAFKRAAKPWHVFASLGWAYDSNIPNDPLDSPGISPQPATDFGDQYQTLSVNAYYHMTLAKKWGLDAGYGFSWLNYDDPDNENSVGNLPYLQLVYTATSWGADLKYSYAYYTADGKSKQSQHGLYPSVYVSEPFGMQSIVTLAFQDKDYRDGGITPDATHLSLRVRQMFTIPGHKLRPYLDLAYGNEDADEAASTYDFMEMAAGMVMNLPYGIGAELSLTGIFTDYDEDGSIGPDNREDEAYLVSAMASKKLWDPVTARLSYLYVRNNSNVTLLDYDPYEYEKHVVYIQMEVAL